MVFTGGMLSAHVALILANMTTVEQMGAQRMRHREQRVLARLHKWYEFRARRETVAQWDGEWGRIGKEGHMWWLGSARKNWEAVMGDSVWMWFREYLFLAWILTVSRVGHELTSVAVPVGQSPDDGLSYTPNLRFDEEGRWRPRSEWPKELQ